MLEAENPKNPKMTAVSNSLLVNIAMDVKKKCPMTINKINYTL
jgi:hypothetical protein